MNTALNELGALANTKMRPANLIAENNHESIILTFQSETEKILNSFPYELLALKSEKKVELRIQQVQSVLIGIADTILTHHTLYSKSYPTNQQFENLYTSTLANIDYLLGFIETRYKQYFNLDQKVPESYLRISRDNLKIAVKKLKAYFINEGLDENFIQVVLYPHIRFLSNTNNIFTYRDLIYIKKLLVYQRELLSTSMQNLKQQLIETLFYFNCNSTQFYNYYIDAITRELEQEQALIKKATLLSLNIKLINQIQQKPGYAFKHKNASIKDQVIYWMEEELVFIEKQQKLVPLFSVPHQPTNDDNGINIIFSVKELAMFIRLMMETGLIYNKNKTYVTQKIAGLFRTKENIIQPYSLSRKIHLKEEHSMRIVKDYLIKMLNLVNKFLDE